MREFYTGQLLCSRLCHDLITPVGAVLSGLELLEEHEGDDTQEIIDLLRLSANECSRHLTLLRFCFGIGASSALASLNEIDATLKKSVDQNKHSFQINFPDSYLAGDPQLKIWAQLLANLFSASLDALPYGGQVAISQGGHQDPQLQLRLKGRLITLPDEVKSVMENGESVDALTPRTIQAYLIWKLAESLSRRITIAQVGEDVFIKTQML